jgi:hypothetical protein
LYDAAEAIAALPLENLGHHDAPRTTLRLTVPIPAGSIWAVVLYEGDVHLFAAPAAKRCRALRWRP